METSSPPNPSIHLLTALYHQLVHTLIEVLPPPRGDTPVGLQARKLSAIGKIAALAPLNADEADLAAHCIAARAQADEMLRLARLNEHDSVLAARLSAEYRSTMRLWLAVYTRLKRVQAERRKRDANPETANQDAWARHIAERSMLAVLEAQPDAGLADAGLADAGLADAGLADAGLADAAPAEPVRPRQAPVSDPASARAAAPIEAKAGAPAAARVAAANEAMPKNKTNSHNMAFETPLSDQNPNPGSAASKVAPFREALLGTTRPFPQEADPTGAAVSRQIKSQNEMILAARLLGRE